MGLDGWLGWARGARGDDKSKYSEMGGSNRVCMQSFKQPLWLVGGIAFGKLVAGRVVQWAVNPAVT
jgi:hypothetical protein